MMIVRPPMRSGRVAYFARERRKYRSWLIYAGLALVVFVYLGWLNWSGPSVKGKSQSDRQKERPGATQFPV
jgi:hypothetical protein